MVFVRVCVGRYGSGKKGRLKGVGRAGIRLSEWGVVAWATPAKFAVWQSESIRVFALMLGVFKEQVGI